MPTKYDSKKIITKFLHKTPKNRIVELAKINYAKYVQLGPEAAHFWMISNVPEQLHYQVKRLTQALSQVPNNYSG